MRKNAQRFKKSKSNLAQNIVSNVFIALGSNKGDRINHLRQAVLRMSNNSKITLLNKSSVYETKPFGNANQPDFLNAVIKVKTSYSLTEMIDYLKNLETELGRKESTKWGPREIDLDLLFFDEIIFKNDKVKVPHYGIQDRDFVLTPLKEIAASFFHPALKLKIQDICTDNISKTIIRKTRYKIN
ncbi:MAG: 2-amino-4-hydroxy-6-hydroxymethyldihydropteridine diphosphokinase [Ignavibacteriaceae bacterium]|nr:2-amino-4-hydroxy-6-hydroxymethyldihydropteridine diphosphokinase [Ignavibacteriaceae bacterium]